MSFTVYLGLGSNQGDSPDLLKKAVFRLGESLTDLVTSSLYRTKPWGFSEQEDFYNIVMRGKTTLSPQELLALTQEIERQFKRVRGIRFGPRTMDIDLLLYEGCIMQEEELTLPHPRMLQRAFVLYPLAEIEPSLILSERPISFFRDALDSSEILEIREF